jgi:hypothetical protein
MTVPVTPITVNASALISPTWVVTVSFNDADDHDVCGQIVGTEEGDALISYAVVNPYNLPWNNSTWMSLPTCSGDEYLFDADGSVGSAFLAGTVSMLEDLDWTTTMASFWESNDIATPVSVSSVVVYEIDAGSRVVTPS